MLEHRLVAGSTLLAAALMLTGGVSPASADTYTPTVLWDNGGADGNFDLDAAWSTGIEPGSSDLVAINNGATVTIDQAGEVVDRIRLASNDGDSGYIMMTGGSLTAGTEVRVGDEGTGTWTQTGGDLVSNNVFWIGARGPGYSASGVGVFNLEGGTVTVNGTSSTAMRIGRAGGTGTLNISGGTWTTAGQFNISASPAATGLPSTGTVNLSGTGTLDVNSTFINDASGSSPGEALLSILGSNATMTVSNYVQNNEGTLSFIADALGVSPIQVSGTTDLEGDLLIDLNALASSVSVIPLIDNSGTNLVIGEFANAPEGTMFGAYTLTYLYDSGDGVANDVALVIPEPMTGMLCLAGFAALCRRRVS